MEIACIFFVILFMGLNFTGGNADPVEDKRALLDLLNNFPHSRNLNWNETSHVCSHWTGVTCSEDGLHVIAVRLPGVGFHGPIPPNTLGRLSELQILSLRSNVISGVFPSDFVNLRNLSFLYLQSNNITGPLPDFGVWENLTIINLSNNDFNGNLPYSLSNLTQLAALNLANNSLSGEIPDLQLPNLLQLNLSDNDLSGIVPKSLQKFPHSAFSGNNLQPNLPPVIAPSAEPHSRSRNAGKLDETTIIGLVIAGCVLGSVAFAFLIFVCCARRKDEDDGFSWKVHKGGMSPIKAVLRAQDANNKLCFFEGCTYAFDLEDLLRASAEVLRKGTFGISYKAILEDATTVVVKRLKEVTVGKRDFEQQMQVIGGIRHENVVELRAYYYSKDEKLMVYDYYSQGSVSTMLHAKRGENKTPLDWDTRMRIAVGAARGIACIHAKNGGKLIHGNIKSSNIFINPRGYGCISDLGLATIISPHSPPIAHAVGYRAPEVTDTRKVAQPCDVYSFGVVLLELLTGKAPIRTIAGDEVVHLVRWVHSVVREEWTAEVFDLELIRHPNIEEEMVEMLQIAMACVVRLPDHRPLMPEVVKMVENVLQFESEKKSYSGTKSESSTPPPPPPPEPPQPPGFEQ